MHSAFLQTNSPETSKPAEYVYDPLDKTFGTLEQNPSDNNLNDQSYSYASGKNAVIYHSAPFENETEVSGFFEINAYIEADIKDVDIEFTFISRVI